MASAVKALIYDVGAQVIDKNHAAQPTGHFRGLDASITITLHTYNRAFTNPNFKVACNAMYRNTLSLAITAPPKLLRESLADRLQYLVIDLQS